MFYYSQCCVFWQAKRCFACHLLVIVIIFLAFLTFLPSQMAQPKKNLQKKKRSTSTKVLLLNTGWHPNAGQLLGKMSCSLSVIKHLKAGRPLFMFFWLFFFHYGPFFAFICLMLKCKKNVFDQQMACKAPVCWSKYPTHQSVRVWLVNKDSKELLTHYWAVQKWRKRNLVQGKPPPPFKVSDMNTLVDS